MRTIRPRLLALIAIALVLLLPHVPAAAQADVPTGEQVGAFLSLERAANLATWLANNGRDATVVQRIVDGRTFYAVIAGPVPKHGIIRPMPDKVVAEPDQAADEQEREKLKEFLLEKKQKEQEAEAEEAETEEIPEAEVTPEAEEVIETDEAEEQAPEQIEETPAEGQPGDASEAEEPTPAEQPRKRAVFTSRTEAEQYTVQWEGTGWEGRIVEFIGGDGRTLYVIIEDKPPTRMPGAPAVKKNLR